MARRDDIVAYLDEILEPGAHPDFCPTGLQVIGSDVVERVVCAVSASVELFEHAAAAGAQMVIVHHGLFWDRDPRVIGEAMKRRLRVLFDHDLSLVAHHLALDAHPTLGNNALLCRELGVEPVDRFGGIGFGGTLDPPCGIEELARRIEQRLGRAPLVFPSGPGLIARVAVCSGGAAKLLADAIAEGYHCFVTGEPAEPTMMAAREAGIHVVAAGHYATETFGVRALGSLLAERFGVEWSFADLPNPV